jgi:hypothetical protein
VAAAGCGGPQGAPPVGWPVTLPSFADWTAAAPVPAWTAPLAGPTTVSLAPDGSGVAGYDGAAWAFTAAGAPVPLAGARGSDVAALPRALFAVGPGVGDPAGAFTLFTASGRVLWSEPAVGPMVYAGSADGARVLALDEGSASGVLLAVDPAGATRLPAPSLAADAAGALVQFDAQDAALVAGNEQVQLLGPAGGSPWWDVTVLGAVPSRELALSPSGADVTVATGPGDDTLYQFSLRSGAPSLAWTEPLEPGGQNQLTVAGNGRIAVWGVGNPGTLAVYRAGDGAMLWQDTLVGAGAAASPSITAVAFGPGDGVVLAAEGCIGVDPCLAFLSPGGARLAYVPLAAGTGVALSADGTVAVEWNCGPGAAGCEVGWWPLAPVWQDLLGPPAAPAASGTSGAR